MDYPVFLRNNVVAPVVSLGVEFLLPARLDDTLAVTARFLKPENAKLEFDYVVRRGSEVLARARSELTDRDTLAASGEAALLPRGCRLTVRLTIAGFEVTRTSGAILWTGLIGTTAFPVHVPPSLKILWPRRVPSGRRRPRGRTAPES